MAMSASHDADLPESLPAGERVLWRGKPEWRELARRALHVRKIGAYFALLLVWYVASSLFGGQALGDVLLATARLAGLALVPLAVLAGYAWLAARSTTYTITSRRVVIRCGVAMPLTINIPFTKIEAANLKLHGSSGEIAMQLARGERIGFLVLWPHVRPWRFGRAEPMLRALANPSAAAQVLARALAASAAVPVAAMAEMRPGNAAAAHAGHAAAAA